MMQTPTIPGLRGRMCRVMCTSAAMQGILRRVAAVLPLLALSLLPEQAPGQTSGDLIGEVSYYRIKEGETLLEIARLHDLGYVELLAANPGMDPWLPPPGRTLLLPTAHLLPDAPRDGIVINLSELRLYYFPGRDGRAVTYPIGIGREGWETPTGTTSISRKREAPTWTPPESIRQARPELPAAVPPGPDNPLGDFALDLGWPRYVIHGTNKPYGIGRRVSSGCIRLYPEDIEDLFGSVKTGVKVTVVDQPMKLGRVDGELYIEAHPDTGQADELESRGRFTSRPVADYREIVTEFAGDDAPRIVWPIVEQAIETRRGIPVRITQ